MSDDTRKFKFIDKGKILRAIFYDEDGNVEQEIIVSKNFYPSKILRNMDTDEAFMIINTQFGNKWITRYLRLDKMQPGKLADYCKYGFPFHDSFKRRLISDWLIELTEENKLPIENSTKGLGWKWIAMKQFFQLQNSISVDNTVNVRYVGNLIIKSMRSYNEYAKFLRKLVLPYIQTQAIVAFSASSALASYLDNELTAILHIRGQTTSGKTTMLMLAASVWSCPKRRKNGIHQTWNATNNSVLNSLCGYRGITICFDEIGASEEDEKSFKTMAYKISMGLDKKRMNGSDSDEEFSINVCSSGEVSMKTESEINGTDVRLFQIEYLWTVSKEHSEEIKDSVKHCFGHLGAEFVKIIQKIPEGKLRMMWKKITSKIEARYQDVISKLPKNHQNVLHRAIQKVAVVALTAYLMKKHLKLNFNPMKIAEFLIEKSSLLDLQIDETIQFLEDYMNYSAEQKRYQQKMLKHMELPDFDKVVDGYKIVKKDLFYAHMRRKLGYTRQEIKHHLIELKKRGFLRCETDRLTYRMTENNIRIQYICFDTRKLDDEGIYYTY
ncbi:MAG: DUF927 domain-containing protein [Oscillospiraceae bacterium]|nr:DUF927 domain-containing protein [Oscillospiraceae bacterium]